MDFRNALNSDEIKILISELQISNMLKMIECYNERGICSSEEVDFLCEVVRNYVIENAQKFAQEHNYKIDNKN